MFSSQMSRTIWDPFWGIEEPLAHRANFSVNIRLAVNFDFSTRVEPFVEDPTVHAEALVSLLTSCDPFAMPKVMVKASEGQEAVTKDAE